MNCDPVLFADDTEVHYSDKDLAITQAKINRVLMKVNDWVAKNRIVANIKKKYLGQCLLDQDKS